MMIDTSSFWAPSEIAAFRRSVTPVAAMILGLLTIAVAVQGNEKQLFILFCLLFSVIVLSSRTLGLALLLPLSFYSLYLRSVLSIPSLFVNLPYVVVFLLALKWFAALIVKIVKKRPIPRTSIDKTILFLFAFIALSFLLNRPPLGPATKSVIQHVGFILLFYALAHSNISESVLKRLQYAVLTVALIQVLASCIQYFFIFADMDQGGRDDRSGGLFGWSSGDVNAVFMVYIFALIFGFIKVYGAKFLYLAAVLVLIIPIALSSARAGFIFIALTGLFLLMVTPLLRGQTLRRDVGQLFGLTVFLAIVLSILGGRYLGFITNPQAVYEYSIGGHSRLRRLDQVVFAHKQISGKAKTVIFGLGPGAMTHTRQGAIGGETQSEFLHEYGHEVRTRQSYLYTTVELGYGGLMLFLFLHYKLFVFSSKVFRGVDDKFWKAIGLGFVGIIFTSAYSIVYTQTWGKPALVFPFWLIAGSLYRVARIKGVV